MTKLADSKFKVGDEVLLPPSMGSLMGKVVMVDMPVVNDYWRPLGERAPKSQAFLFGKAMVCVEVTIMQHHWVPATRHFIPTGKEKTIQFMMPEEDLMEPPCPCCGQPRPKQ